MIKNTQNQNMVYYCSEIDVYSLSKILFLIGWHHQLVFVNNKSHIWHFNENDKLLIFTNVPILSCNVEYLAVSDKSYNTKKLLIYLKTIGLNNNININIDNISDGDVLAYHLYDTPALELAINHKNLQKNSFDFNLPIAIYNIKKTHKYENLLHIFSYLFKETGCHSLAIVLYNMIKYLELPESPKQINNTHLLQDMILY